MFDWLRKTPKILDAVLKGGDAVVFTNEEKSEWMLKAWDATALQNLARRYLAIGVFFIWAISALVVLVSLTVAVWTDVDVGKVDPLIEFLTRVTIPFSVIIGFYFWKRFNPGGKPTE